MRTRFFLTAFTILVIVTGVSVFLLSSFLRKERINLIDNEVRATAAALIDGKLATLKQIDFQEADKVISKELAFTPSDKIIIIRNSAGNILFESNPKKFTNIQSIPQSPQWLEYRVDGKFFRILNLQLPTEYDRALQVGVAVEENFVRPFYFAGQSFILMIFGILGVGMIISYFLVSFLLHPLAELESFLNSANKTLRGQTKLPVLPDHFFYKENKGADDEFQKMLVVLDGLLKKVNKTYQISRLWAYQMAHELKTPLSIMRLETERLEKNYTGAPEDLKGILAEQVKISDTINAFLAWAELENSSGQQHLYMNNLNAVLDDILFRFIKNSTRKIEINFSGTLQIAANPQHLQQLIFNLISNADNYSSSGKPILVKTTHNNLTIQDFGSGIPQQVLTRLGEPFNRGENTKAKPGHGLGLAWVKSICKMYGWNITFESDGDGTIVCIEFNFDEPEESLDPGDSAAEM